MSTMGPVILNLLKPCIGKEWAQILVTHYPTPNLCLLSIPQPSLRKVHPIFCSSLSIPSRSVTQAVLSLGKGLGRGWTSGCLLTSASTPETSAHYSPSAAQDPRLCTQRRLEMEEGNILFILLHWKEYHKLVSQ